MHILSKTVISVSVAGALLVTIASYTHAAKPEKEPQIDAQIEAPKDGLGMITGTVTDADSKPLKGVAVGLQFQNRRTQNGGAQPDNKQTPPPTTKPVAIQTTKTDANGHYTFEHVKPGIYVVIARDRQHGNFRKQVVLGENQEVTVDMKLKARPGQTGNPDNNQKKTK